MNKKLKAAIITILLLVAAPALLLGITLFPKVLIMTIGFLAFILFAGALYVHILSLL